MTIALASPPPRPISCAFLAGPVWEATLNTWHGPSRLVRRGTVGVVAVSVVIPLLGVCRVAFYDPDSTHAIQALVASATVLPVQIWLVLAAARGAVTARHRWALAAVAAVLGAALPVIGMNWLAALYPLGALVLVVLDRPLSVVLFVGLVIAAAPLATVFGDVRWSAYFAIGTLMYGISVAVPVWLIAGVRQLESTRRALADEAVIQERLRIDTELRRGVGAALETIAETADRAAGHVRTRPASAELELRALVDGSRRTLTETRRIVSRFQATSLREELEGAAALLAASGVRTRLVVPPGFPDTVEEAQRVALRSDVARLLRHEDVRECVCTVVQRDGRIWIELSHDGVAA